MRKNNLFKNLFVIGVTTLSLAFGSEYKKQPTIYIDPYYTNLAGKQDTLTKDKLKELNFAAMSRAGINHKITEGVMEVEIGYKFKTVNDLVSFVGARGQYQLMPETIVDHSHIKPYDWKYYEKKRTSHNNKQISDSQFKSARIHSKKKLYAEAVKVAGSDRRITLDELIAIDPSFHPELNALITARYLAFLYYNPKLATFKSTEKTLSAYYSGYIKGRDGEWYYTEVRSNVFDEYPLEKMNLWSEQAKLFSARTNPKVGLTDDILILAPNNYHNYVSNPTNRGLATYSPLENLPHMKKKEESKTMMKETKEEKQGWLTSLATKWRNIKERKRHYASLKQKKNQIFEGEQDISGQQISYSQLEIQSATEFLKQLEKIQRETKKVKKIQSATEFLKQLEKIQSSN